MKHDLIGPFTFSLRDNSHCVWFLPEQSDGIKRISRIFISCPEPDLTSLVPNIDSVRLRRITDVFGLLSAVTGVQRLNFLNAVSIAHG